MNTRYFVSLIFSFILMSCGSQVKDFSNFQKYFEGTLPVDCTDLLVMYDEFMAAPTQDSALRVTDKLNVGKYGNEDNFGYYSFTDTAFAVSLPQYEQVGHKFLAHSESIYNSYMYMLTIWTVHNIWMRDNPFASSFEIKELKDDMCKVSDSCIDDEELRLIARNYRDSLLLVMDTTYRTTGLNPYSKSILEESSRKARKIYASYVPDDKLLADSIADMRAAFLSITDDKIKAVMSLPKDQWVKSLFASFNQCESFDEQCSLLLNWYCQRTPFLGSEWMIAMADKLLYAGKYNPFLDEIWELWRYSLRAMYYGVSQVSLLPQAVINNLRRTCYVSCLKRLESHPSDRFAISCAYDLLDQGDGYIMLGMKADYPRKNMQQITKHATGTKKLE